MNTTEEFLTELEREWIKTDPLDRHIVTLGYAKHMQAREDAIRKEAYITGGIETLVEGVKL